MICASVRVLMGGWSNVSRASDMCASMGSLLSFSMWQWRRIWISLPRAC